MDNLQPNFAAEKKIELAERLIALRYLGPLRILSAQYIAQDNLRAAYGDLLIFYRGEDSLVEAFYADVDVGGQNVDIVEIFLGRPAGRLVFYWRPVQGDLISYVSRDNWAITGCQVRDSYAICPTSLFLSFQGVRRYSF